MPRPCYTDTDRQEYRTQNGLAVQIFNSVFQLSGLNGTPFKSFRYLKRIQIKLVNRICPQCVPHITERSVVSHRPCRREQEILNHINIIPNRSDAGTGQWLPCYRRLKSIHFKFYKCSAVNNLADLIWKINIYIFRIYFI